MEVEAWFSPAIIVQLILSAFVVAGFLYTTRALAQQLSVKLEDFISVQTERYLQIQKAQEATRVQLQKTQDEDRTSNRDQFRMLFDRQTLMEQRTERQETDILKEIRQVSRDQQEAFRQLYSALNDKADK